MKLAPMHKLLVRSGATRVSEEGAFALGIFLEELGFKISEEAVLYASHSGRKTVKKRDIEIATRKVLERAKSHSSSIIMSKDKMTKMVEAYLKAGKKTNKKKN